MTYPCTACKHFKPDLTCKLTGLSTERSRAYKTDEDDCFDDRWSQYDTNEAKEKQKKKMQEMTHEERYRYLHGDFTSNKDG